MFCARTTPPRTRCSRPMIRARSAAVPVPGWSAVARMRAPPPPARRARGGTAPSRHQRTASPGPVQQGADLAEPGLRGGDGRLELEDVHAVFGRRGLAHRLDHRRRPLRRVFHVVLGRRRVLLQRVEQGFEEEGDLLLAASAADPADEFAPRAVHGRGRVGAAEQHRLHAVRAHAVRAAAVDVPRRPAREGGGDAPAALARLEPKALEGDQQALGGVEPAVRVGQRVAGVEQRGRGVGL